MKINEKWMKTDENQWKMKGVTCYPGAENQWTSMKNEWKPMKINEQWMKTDENQWKMKGVRRCEIGEGMWDLGFGIEDVWVQDLGLGTLGIHACACQGPQGPRGPLQGPRPQPGAKAAQPTEHKIRLEPLRQLGNNAQHTHTHSTHTHTQHTHTHSTHTHSLNTHTINTHTHT